MILPVILEFLSGIMAGLMALSVAIQGRLSAAHWLFVFGMAALAAEAALAGLAMDAVIPADAAQWQKWRLLVVSALPGLWVLFSLDYARAESWERWKRGWRARTGLALLPVVLTVFFQEQLVGFVFQEAPGVPLVMPLGAWGIALQLILLTGAVVTLMNLERTYRAAVGTMRWRIKYMILGVGVLFAVRTYTASQAILFRVIDPSVEIVNAGALLLVCFLTGRSLVRSGHFEVSVYPSRAVLRGSITVLLAGIYLVLVGALGKFVTVVGGDGAFQLRAFLVLVLLVLLAVVLLSDRTRLYIQRFISRHFKRPEYDYRTLWKTFTEATARQVKQRSLCTAVIKLVSEILQTLSVTIWLVNDRQDKLQFAASTLLTAPADESADRDREAMASALKNLRECRNPIDLDATKETWAPVLRRYHPDQFEHGGNRLCVPIATSDELLGVMMLGDRVGGVPFTLQDSDLLSTVAEQVAASLMNIRLGQQLSQAKQLEAFQTMSAFFVHDLKNTASTLSLMLQNLPDNFDNPEFRKDALRGISKSVVRINDVIGRLSLIRKELAIQPVETDLNEIVNEALKCLAGNGGVSVTKNLGVLPLLEIDPAQIGSVVTNLALNARDAVGSSGEIRVATSQQDGWVVLTVEDSGCGISPEFMRDSLFRPFQTTKKKGIGIGIYQCKMIVEAHKGRIEVESEVGKGSVFRIMLPGREARNSKHQIPKKL